MDDPLTISLLDNIFPEDVDAINELLFQLDETSPHITLNNVMSMIQSHQAFVFVAKENNTHKIIGMTSLIPFVTLKGKRANLEDVVVHDNFRSKGIGKRLVSAAIEKAKQEGVKYIDLTSRPSREVANILYQHLGFKKRETNIYRLEL